jgi:hypothetical protein
MSGCDGLIAASTSKSVRGQKRRFDRAPITSGLPRKADNFRADTCKQLPFAPMNTGE